MTLHAESGNALPPSAVDRLIVALDLPTARAALRMADQLRGAAGAFKVGLELFSREGPAVVRQLVEEGAKVFLDLKLHDIPNTVQAAAREAATLGAAMLDVHAAGGRKMMEAALEGARSNPSRVPVPKVLAVTLLTSLAFADLEEIGMAGGPDEVVVQLARLAQKAGLDGVVASPEEAKGLRRVCGADFILVTPGIRPAGSPAADQSRHATPGEAIRAGADYLVVGRPIIRAENPRRAAEAVLAEIAEALTNLGAKL